MTDRSVEINKICRLLDIFYYQHDFKYKFKPENFINHLKQQQQKAAKNAENAASGTTSEKPAKKSRQGIVIGGVRIPSAVSEPPPRNEKVYDVRDETKIRERLQQLEKDGLLASRALPKVMEPTRCKAHWDYLLEEMEWMQADFKSSLIWKKTAALALAEEAAYYVKSKQELERMNIEQQYTEARLHCKQVARMVEEYWMQKKKDLTSKTDHSLIDKILEQAENSSNAWFSKKLIQSSVSCDNLLDDDIFAYKSVTGSDSVCSFTSANEDYSTLFSCLPQINSFTSDEGILMQGDTTDYSIDFIENKKSKKANNIDDAESSVCSFDMYEKDAYYDTMSTDKEEVSEMIHEVDWLRQDAEKIQLFSEISELINLSQQPIDELVDEQYFDMHKSMLEDSDDERDESLSSADSCVRDVDALARKRHTAQLNVLSEVTETTESPILATIVKLNLINDQYMNTQMDNDEPDTISELLHKTRQMMLRLYDNNLPFILKFNRNNSFQRVALANHLSQLTSAYPCLVVCSQLMLQEWQMLLSLFHCHILLLDNVNTQSDLSTLTCYLEQQQKSDGNVICVISYSALCRSQQFAETMNWNIVIYDEFQDVLLSTIKSRYFVPPLTQCSRRICVIENDDMLKPTYSHLFCQYLFSSFIWQHLLGEITYLENASAKKLFEQINEGLSVNLMIKNYTYETLPDCSTVVCESTEIQTILHTYVMDKLKSSLETRNLIDFMEAVTQGVSICQHPLFFPCESPEDKAMYDSILRRFPNLQDRCNDSHYESIILKFNCKFARSRLHTKLRRCCSDIYKIPTSFQFSDNSLFLEQFRDCIDPMYACRQFFSITTDNVKKEPTESIKQESIYGNVEDEYPFLDDNQIHFINREFMTPFKNPDKLNSDIQNSYSLLWEPPSFRNTYYAYKRLLPHICDDLNIAQSRLGPLRRMCTVSKWSSRHVFGHIERFKFINPKQIQKKFKQSVKGEVSMMEMYIYQELKKLWVDASRSYTMYDYSNCKTDIELSGKLQIFDTLFDQAILDSTVHQIIIMSHNFELLNMLEHFIKANYKYGSKASLLPLYSIEPKFRLLQNKMIDKFNVSSQFKFNRKSILLIHTRTNILNLYRLIPNDCAIFSLDFHWSPDSNSVVSDLISRWNMNSILCSYEPSFMFNLCAFNTLEQYFVTHNLSFLYNNCYHDTTSNSVTTIVCQQALLKHFVERLEHYLKQYLISGFNIDDFHTNLEDATHLTRVDTTSIDDVFLCFESARDAELINYSLLLQKFGLCELQNIEQFPMHDENDENTTSTNHVLKAMDLDIKNDETDFYENWEKIVREKIQNLIDMDLFTSNPEMLFYDPNLMNVSDDDNCAIWDPPMFDPDAKYVPPEIQNNMYESSPMEVSQTYEQIPTKVSSFTFKNKKSAAASSQVSRKHSLNSRNQHRDFELLGMKIEKQVHHHGNHSNSSNTKKRKFSNVAASNHEDAGDHASLANVVTQKRRKYSQHGDMDASGTSTMKSGSYKYEKSMADSKLGHVSNYHHHLKDDSMFDNVKDFQLDSYTDMSGLDTKKNPSPQHTTASSVHDPSDSNDEYTAVTNTSIPKLNLPKPLYLMETNKSIKNKRQHHQQQMSHCSSSSIKPIMGGASSHHITQHKFFLANRRHLSLQKPIMTPDYGALNEIEIDIFGEWHLHEEVYFYQNVYHIQQCPLSNHSRSKSHYSDKLAHSTTPNIRISEFYLNNYSTNITYRSYESCQAEFNRLHDGYVNLMTVQNSASNNASGNNSNVSCSKTSGSGAGTGSNAGSSRTKNANIHAATSVSYLDSRSSTGALEMRQGSGRKIKMGRLKGSSGSGVGLGSSNCQSSSHQQAHTNKIKLLHQLSLDLSSNISRSSQITQSISNTSHLSNSYIIKCVDDVVNKTRLTPPNHSQTIKKNATHTSALEDHNINPDKIFTPAMLIQRRDELNKEREERESEINLSRQQHQQQQQEQQQQIQRQQHQQIIASGTQTFRSNPYEAAGHMRRKQATVGNYHQFYNIQHQSQPSGTRQRYPVSRQLQGSVLHHQANTVSIPSTIRASTIQYTTNTGSIVTGTGGLPIVTSSVHNSHVSGGSIVMAHHNPTIVSNQGVASVSIGTSGVSINNRGSINSSSIGGSTGSNTTAYHFQLQQPQPHVTTVTNQGRHIGTLGVSTGQNRTNTIIPRVFCQVRQPASTHRAPLTTVSTAGSVIRPITLGGNAGSSGQGIATNNSGTSSVFSIYQQQQPQNATIRTFTMQQQPQQQLRQGTTSATYRQIGGLGSGSQISNASVRNSTTGNATTIFTSNTGNIYNSRVQQQQQQQQQQHFNHRNNG